MKFNLTRKGIECPIENLNAQEIKFLRSKLTVSTKGYNNRIISMKGYIICNKVMYLARMKGIELLDKLGHSVENKIPLGDDLSTDPSMANLTLKDFQQKLYDFISEKVYSHAAEDLGMSSCIMDLQPGKGKSYIAMALIQYIYKKTLYIVPGIDLQTQTVNIMRGVFPMLRIATFNGKVQEDGDIVVMTIDSAVRQTDFSSYGFTIFDEIHEYCTPKTQLVFYKCCSRFTLGMSGTCFHRLDGMDPIAHHHIGSPLLAKKLVNLDTITKEWKFYPSCIRYNGPPEYTKSILSSAGTVSVPLMLNQFSIDPYRSQVLINTVRKFATGNKIFVLLDRTLLIDLVQEYLQTLNLEISRVTGSTSLDERSAARKSQIVIGTYACIGTGISWDEYNVIIFWHPRRNKFEQFLNRIFRENGDIEVERHAVFLQDNATSLKTQFAGFKKICQTERKKEPSIEVVNYEDIEPSEEVKKIAEKFAKWLETK